MKQEAGDLSQKMLLHHIHEADGKLFLILYIEYLEKFATNTSYSGIEELLGQHHFDSHEIESMMNILYKGSPLDDDIKTKILHQLITNNE